MVNAASLDLIREVAAELTDVDLAGATPESRLDGLGIDSLTLTEMIFVLEDRTGLSLIDHEPPPATVGDLVALLDAAPCSAKS